MQIRQVTTPVTGIFLFFSFNPLLAHDSGLLSVNETETALNLVLMHPDRFPDRLESFYSVRPHLEHWEVDIRVTEQKTTHGNPPPWANPDVWGLKDRLLIEYSVRHKTEPHLTDQLNNSTGETLEYYYPFPLQNYVFANRKFPVVIENTQRMPHPNRHEDSMIGRLYVMAYDLPITPQAKIDVQMVGYEFELSAGHGGRTVEKRAIKRTGLEPGSTFSFYYDVEGNDRTQVAGDKVDENGEAEVTIEVDPDKITHTWEHKNQRTCGRSWESRSRSGSSIPDIGIPAPQMVHVVPSFCEQNGQGMLATSFKTGEIDASVFEMGVGDTFEVKNGISPELPGFVFATVPEDIMDPEDDLSADEVYPTLPKFDGVVRLQSRNDGIEVQKISAKPSQIYWVLLIGFGLVGLGYLIARLRQRQSPVG